MALPRWVLFSVSMASLVVLTYAGVLLAFSLPVTSEMAAGDAEAAVGSRAIVVPVNEPQQVRALAGNETGTLLAVGTRGGALPSDATDVRLARALRYVAAGENGTFEWQNTTFDLAATTGGAEGWLVVDASSPAVGFVARERVVGEVARFESPARLALLFASGAIGFVAPLVVVIVTHRGAARRGVAAAPIVCRECRAPMSPDSPFCLRCGAYSRGD